MTLIEYHIKCPNCGSETKFVSKEVSPIMLQCAGCNRSIVVQGNNLYTVSKDYMSRILFNHKFRVCGQVVASKVSGQVKGKSADERLKALHELLEQNIDVAEFLKKV